jgi:uncharacterized Zn-finger protein
MDTALRNGQYIRFKYHPWLQFMVPSTQRLCSYCNTLANYSQLRQPQHLVHPVTRKWRMCDERGYADCPRCGARWQLHSQRRALLVQ